MPDARLDNNTLHLSRIFDAPRERVFDAWTKQDQFVQWMCPPGVEITMCEIDVRPGGAWRIDGRHERERLRLVGHLSRGGPAGAAGLHLGAPCRRRFRPAARPRDDGAGRVARRRQPHRADPDPRPVRRCRGLRLPQAGLGRHASTSSPRSSGGPHDVASRSFRTRSGSRRSQELLAKEKEFTAPARRAVARAPRSCPGSVSRRTMPSRRPKAA